jgi:hypothetical protein
VSCVLRDSRFWVSVVSAFITLLAVLVALFGRDLRALFKPPKLRMDLARENGLAVSVWLTPPPSDTVTQPHMAQGRGYHFRISNPRRKVDKVEGVSVTLLRVENRGKDGEYHETWSGDVPLKWRNEPDNTPPERKVVGTWADGTMVGVVKDKWLDISMKVIPFDLQWRYRVPEDMPVDIAMTVQARGNEADSEIQRWRVFWDGKWEDGDLEMRKHLSVTPLPLKS